MDKKRSAQTKKGLLKKKLKLGKSASFKDMWDKSKTLAKKIMLAI